MSYTNINLLPPLFSLNLQNFEKTSAYQNLPTEEKIREFSNQVIEKKRQINETPNKTIQKKQKQKQDLDADGKNQVLITTKEQLQNQNIALLNEKKAMQIYKQKVDRFLLLAKNTKENLMQEIDRLKAINQNLTNENLELKTEIELLKFILPEKSLTRSNSAEIK